MTAAASPADGATGWSALPQPTELALSGGVWRSPTARVVADGALSREGERLAAELEVLGIRAGDGAEIRFCVDDHAGEGFQIEVADDIVIRAGSAAGAFRASRQLLHNVRAQGAVPRGNVESVPAVAERGFHLDAARKYYPADWILALLHELADIGINTFQWHFSENEGFRIASEAFPEIVSPDHITRDEVRQIVAAAADLHIDVVPSLDMPGHLLHVLAAHPEMRLPPGAGELTTEHALNILDDRAVAFAHALIDDMIPLFPHNTRWNLGGDEFIDFAQIDRYPALQAEASRRYGGDATGFDLLTEFVNRTAAHLRQRGFEPRVWNDGMLRSTTVALDPEVTLAWWTNWHADMRPLAAAIAAGHSLVNVNDALFYYVLGEKAGYRYPRSERIWQTDWHPGRFPDLPGGGRQELSAPYPTLLRGVSFAVWADDPAAQTPADVAAGVRAPVRAMAERAWNAGSALSHEEFLELDDTIGLAPPTVRSGGGVSWNAADA